MNTFIIPYKKINMIKEYIDNYLNSMIILKQGNISIDCNITTLSITAEYKLDLPVFPIHVLFSDSPLSVKINAEVNIFSRAEKLRIMDVITRTTTNIKGIGKIIENLKKLLN